MRHQKRRDAPHGKFVRLCTVLARAWSLVRRNRSSGPRRAGRRSERDRLHRLSSELELAGIGMDAQALISAGDGAFLTAAAIASIAAVVAFVLAGSQDALILVLAGVAVSAIAREAVTSYPASAANKRAERMMRDVPEAANLMVMSLRHESSLSKAIRFASERGSEFSLELKQCVWNVVMGRQASFEDSLQELGARWERHDPDLKASFHAMVTASCEATEDGKRRALDRANNAIMSGARRRIEAYALSLSTPSMVIFGLGILLPLMIGSFVPMMSWSIWSPGDLASGEAAGGDGNMVETVFLMNVLFPCVALLIAMGAVSRHPLGNSPKRTRKGAPARVLAGSAAVSAIATAWSYLLLEGTPRMLMCLLSLTVPWAFALAALGKGAREGADKGVPGNRLEDALFRTGARMLEGENFESALHRAGDDIDGKAAGMVRSISFRSAVAGQGFDGACRDESRSGTDSNALEGLRVVHEAAAKDELAAGMLAMDLAAYLKDLHDLETTLKNRLRPTISMMRMTAFALGPVVMGVTFAIYLTLMSMAPGGTEGMDAGIFFIVLGAFLAETNGVVSYFVWGIEGREDPAKLMWNFGTCVLVSELVYVATATVAA